MLCALSGNETSDAVVSPKSGGIFDRKLAHAYVTTSGKDPLNDEPLTVEELIEVSNNGIPAILPPKPAEFHSIPTMLAAFQNEWDAVALEVFELRKQLHNSRQELSLALYKYDAAVRVAAKATREKEEAQRALQQISESFASTGGKNDGIVDGNDLPKEEILSATSNKTFSLELAKERESLFALHKQLKISLPVTATSALVVKKSEENLSIKGALDLAVNPGSGHLVVVGKSGSLLLPQKIEKPKFAAVAFLNDAAVASPIGLDEQELHLLENDEKFTVSIPNTRRVITHPSLPYFVALTADDTWVLAAKTGVIHTSTSSGSIYTADIHVDGALLGMATVGKIDIIDLTTFATVSSIETPNLASVSHIKFALNGYWLFVGGQTQSGTHELRVYDLRKASLAHTFETGADAHFAIDPSCQVLAVCDKVLQKLNVHLYAKKGKKWLENMYEEECGAIEDLQIESSAEEVQLSKLVKLAGLLGDRIVHFEIGLE